MLQNDFKPAEFSLVTKVLHLSIALLFVLQYLLMWGQKNLAEASPKLPYMLWHKSFGLIILALSIAMLLAKARYGRPALGLQKTWEIFLAKFVHYFLYVVMLLQPLTGILMSVYAGYPVPFFHLAKLPLFVTQNKNLGQFFDDCHVGLAYVILVLVGLHVAAAIFHHVVRKDNILSRMLWIRI